MLGINQREDVAAAAALATGCASPLPSHPLVYTPLIKSDKRFRFAVGARLSIDFQPVGSTQVEVSWYFESWHIAARVLTFGAIHLL